MGRTRKTHPESVDVIRIGQGIRCHDHPDIADLYRETHSNFAPVVRDALSLCAYIRRATGARTLAEMIGVVSQGIDPAANGLVRDTRALHSHTPGSAPSLMVVKPVAAVKPVVARPTDRVSADLSDDGQALSETAAALLLKASESM